MKQYQYGLKTHDELKSGLIALNHSIKLDFSPLINLSIAEN